MPIWQAIILGVIQGLTEFLPVSSSAHLAVMPFLTGWQDQGLQFDIAVHFGTLMAVVAFFFRDWVQIIAQGFGINPARFLAKEKFDSDIARNPMLLWLLVAATIPAGVIGLLWQDEIEQVGNNLYAIGTMLILVGLVMWWAEKASQRRRHLDTVSFTDAAIIGASQALAVIPGTSRSGITISAGLFRNIDRYAAARFSFLLSTPIIAGASAKNFLDMAGQGVPADTVTSFAVGIVASAITGALTIRFFLDFLRRKSLRFFVAYRIIFGIIVIALAFFRA